MDKLMDVYPMNPESTRNLNPVLWSQVEKYFGEQNFEKLIDTLLEFELFPIKDSYVAFLKKDRNALKRNIATTNRIGSSLMKMGLSKIKEKCSEPKETNRQIGPMFKNWVNRGSLGLEITQDAKFFSKSSKNLILNLSDVGLTNFANSELDYQAEKGLDLIAKVNGQYVVGEAKFLTDFGGHQNAQFNDAMNLVSNSYVKAVKVAIIDGVPYISRQEKMCKAVRKNVNYNIMSVLVLKEFLGNL